MQYFTLKSRCPSLYTFSIPPRTLLNIFTCPEMPFLKNPVWALRITLSSNAALADFTISWARYTVLMEDRDRLDARRCSTSVCRETSGWWLIEWEGDCAGDKEAWLPVAGSLGEVDMLNAGSRIYLCADFFVICWDASCWPCRMVFEVRGWDEAVVRLMGTVFEKDPPSNCESDSNLTSIPPKTSVKISWATFHFAFTK